MYWNFYSSGEWSVNNQFLFLSYFVHLIINQIYLYHLDYSFSSNHSQGDKSTVPEKEYSVKENGKYPKKKVLRRYTAVFPQHRYVNETQMRIHERDWYTASMKKFFSNVFLVFDCTVFQEYEI